MKTETSAVNINRNIGDFSRWKEHDSYQKSLERLMRDLRVKQDSSDAPETR